MVVSTPLRDIEKLLAVGFLTAAWESSFRAMRRRSLKRLQVALESG